MGMILLVLMQASIVQINSSYPERITIVATAEEPKVAHHPALDDPQYRHLLPLAVTIRTRDRAIKTITVQWDVTFEDGSMMSYPAVFTTHPGEHDYPMDRHGEATFWPGGFMPNVASRHAMMSMPPNLEHATMASFLIDFIQFEDGLTLGPDTLHTLTILADAEKKRKR